jgi:hypothetical protein
MGEISRGQDTQIQIFNVDGELISILNPTTFSADMDSTEERQNRLGEREEIPRQILHGFSGSCGFEEEGPVLDDLIDAQVNGFLNGEKVHTIDILDTQYYPETGQERTYVYPGAVFKISKSVSDKTSAVDRSLTWTSKMRRLV